MMQYSVYAVLSHAALGVNLYSCHGEIDRYESTLCAGMMVELWTRKRDGGNHHLRLGLKRIPGANQCTIPDKAGATPDLAGKNTDMSSSKPKEASRAGDFSFPLVSWISCPSSSPISLSCRQLYYHRRTQSKVIPVYVSMP